MTKFFSLINGKFKDSISVLDRGLAYGDGFFETMLWKRKHPGATFDSAGVEFWQRHVKRIKKGCHLLQIKFPNPSTLIKYKQKILSRACNSGLKDGILKILITRGQGGRGYKFEKNITPTVIFLVFPKKKIGQNFFDKGVKVRFCKSSLSTNNDFAGLKHLNRLDSVLARSEWVDDYFEGILLDQQENLIEGTMTNIFFIKKNKLYTPSIIDSGIEGIMRGVVMESYKNFFKKIKLTKIHKKDLENFDEMFLTNSVLKILPVRQMGRKKFKISENTKNFMNFLRTKKNLEFI